MKKSNITAAYNSILLSLIAELNAAEQSSFFQGWDIVQTWPTEVMNSLLKVGLLELAADAKSLECQGCERRCFSDVIIFKNAPAFIVCEEPAMQNTMGAHHYSRRTIKEMESKHETIRPRHCWFVGFR